MKGEIKNFKILKNDNSKIYLVISLELFEGTVVSVQLQIVPCCSLYLFSRSIGPLQGSQC